MDGDIKTQRFGIGRIFREGWRLYNAEFTHILAVGLCVYIPINIFTGLITYYFPGANSTQQLSLLNDITSLLKFFVGALATMAIAYIVEQAVREEPTTWREALRHARSRWGGFIGTSVLAGMIILGLMFLLIIPAIVWGVYYSFYSYAVALRNVGGGTALSYSKSMVQGQWWRVLGITLVIFICGGIVGFAVGLLLAIPYAYMSGSFIAPLVAIGVNTITDMLEMAFVVPMVVFFLNTDYLRNPRRGKVASYNHGMANSKEGKYALAIADFSQAIELDPGYAHAYFQRGNADVAVENFEHAMLDYSKAIELDSQNKAAYYKRGNVNLGQGAFDQAIADYSKAIELDANYKLAYNNRGAAHKNLGQFEQAIADYTRAIELDPGYTDGHFNRGMANFSAGDSESAIADYTKVIELEANYAAAYDKREMALAKTGQNARAIDDLQMYLRLESNASDRNDVEQMIQQMQAQ